MNVSYRNNFANEIVHYKGIYLIDKVPTLYNVYNNGAIVLQKVPFETTLLSQFIFRKMIKQFDF